VKRKLLRRIAESRKKAIKLTLDISPSLGPALCISNAISLSQKTLLQGKGVDRARRDVAPTGARPEFRRGSIFV
jgi:hypothetical protein